MPRIASQTDQMEIFGQLLDQRPNEDLDAAIDRLMALADEEVDSAQAIEASPLTLTAGC
jgi:hypothetical protein